MSLTCLQYLCNFSFFKSSDLRKSSLNITSPKKCGGLKIDTKLIKQNTNESFDTDAKREGQTPMKANKEKSLITEKHFRILQILRIGKNFKTYMVKNEGDQQTYAMKLIGRKTMTKNSVTDQVTMEKEILEKAKHPFIPKLAWYFENEKKIFLVMEYVEGEGTLNHALKQLSRFSEEITRFYSAEILLTLEYLHKELQVAYSDLKLRNFHLDSQSHVKLIDFSHAKKIPTHDGVAQQLFSSPSKDSSQISQEELADFWGLGCLIYELLTGRKPFSRGDTADSDTEEVSPLGHVSWPCSISKNAKDLITRLLGCNSEDKAGFSSIDEIKKHAFFAQVNWEKMLNKSVYPPLDLSQLKGNNKQDDTDDDQEYEEVKMKVGKFSKASSMQIMEESSLCDSEEGIEPISFDRTTCMNSILGYK